MSSIRQFSHLNQNHDVCMVNIFEKNYTHRIALAKGRVCMNKEAYTLLTEFGKNGKGEVLNTARIAAILAAKRCSDLIPLCHNLPLNHVDVKFFLNNKNSFSVDIIAQCEAYYKTGVEMEAMLACSIAALTIYDMCKSVDKGIIIQKIQLDRKTGGKSGDWKNS